MNDELVLTLIVSFIIAYVATTYIAMHLAKQRQKTWNNLIESMHEVIKKTKNS